MRNDYEATYAGITFYGKTQAAAEFQVIQYRLESAIDNGKHLDALSYENIKAHHAAGTLATFLLSLAPSELAVVISNTVTARNGKYSVLEVYDTYQKIIEAYQTEQARIELVKIEADYGCPEARAEMSAYNTLANYI